MNSNGMKVKFAPTNKEARLLAMLSAGTANRDMWMGKTAGVLEDGALSNKVQELLKGLKSTTWADAGARAGQWIKDNQQALGYGLGSGLLAATAGGIGFGKKGALLGLLLGMLGGGSYGAYRQSQGRSGPSSLPGPLNRTSKYDEALKQYAEDNPRPDRKDFSHWYMPKDMENNQYAKAMNKWIDARREHARQQAGIAAVEGDVK